MSSGEEELERYSFYERVLHWLVALSFLYAALTGLALWSPRKKDRQKGMLSAKGILADLNALGGEPFGPGLTADKIGRVVNPQKPKRNKTP